jgi:hypothetical protein
MSTDSFLDALLNDQQPQFALTNFNEFNFVGDINQPDSALSELNIGSSTNTVLPRCSIEIGAGSDQTKSPKVVEDILMLECSADLADHL